MRERCRPVTLHTVWTLLIGLRLVWSIVVVTLRRLRATTPPRLKWTADVLADVIRRLIDATMHLPVAAARRRLPATIEPPWLRVGLRFERHAVVGGRPAEIVTPRAWAAGSPVLLYLHGGGYVACSPHTHRDVVARLAIASGARVVSLDYRLAPEHPFPAALDDAVAALRELRGSHRLFVGGDSAGGGLALAAMLRLTRDGEPLPHAAVLFSPWVDLSPERASKAAHAPACLLTPRAVATYLEHYVGDHDARDPFVSPLLGDHRALPPVLVQTGAEELIHDEHLELARRVEAAGVDVTLRVFPRQVHVFQMLAPFLREGRAAIDDAGAFLREH